MTGLLAERSPQDDDVAHALRAYAGIEHLTARIATRRAFEGWKLDSRVLAEHYTDVLGELRGLLDEAVGRRIRFPRTGLDYVPLSRDYILAREGEERARLRYADLRRTRDKLHQEFGRSWALNVPLLVKIGH